MIELSNRTSARSSASFIEPGFRVLSRQSIDLDTTTAGSRLVFGIFATLAEFQHGLVGGERGVVSSNNQATLQLSHALRLSAKRWATIVPFYA